MRIYRRGQTWWVDFTRDGERLRQSLGTRDRSEAERIAKVLARAISPVRRAPPPRVPKPQGIKARDRLSVRQVLRQWLAFQEPRRKPNSLQTYRIIVKRFSMVWGALQVDEVTREKIEEFQETALQHGLAPRTINHQLGLAIAALRWAQDRGLVDTPPPPWKRLDVRGCGSRKYLTTTEMAKLFTALKKPSFARLTSIVMLAAYAGLRRSEIIWLEWCDVDLDEGWLHVRAKRGWSPKTSASERSIPLTEELLDYLKGPRRCDRWVAPFKPGAQWNRRHLGINIRRLFKSAGVDDGGPHTLHRLRGTFATQVLRMSGDLRSLQAMLGHGNLAITSIYLSEVDEHKRAAVRGLGWR